jgi:hypothetical protein
MTRPAKLVTAYTGTRIRGPAATCRAWTITGSVLRMHNSGLDVQMSPGGSAGAPDPQRSGCADGGGQSQMTRMARNGTAVAAPTIFMYENHLIE